MTKVNLIEILPHPPPGAKYLAFSPDGKRADAIAGELLQELCLFGLSNLMFEILDL
jgi:hypothetical protein